MITQDTGMQEQLEQAVEAWGRVDAVVQSARQVISAADAMENGGLGVPPADHARLGMVKAEGELLLGEALAALDRGEPA